MREFIVHSFVPGFSDSCFSTSFWRAWCMPPGIRWQFHSVAPDHPITSYKSPSLSPCNFAIYHVWKEASSPSAYTEKGDKAIIWGVRHWAGFHVRCFTKCLSRWGLEDDLITNGWRSDQPCLCNEATVETKRTGFRKLLGWRTRAGRVGAQTGMAAPRPLLPCLLHLCHLAVPKLHLFI